MRRTYKFSIYLFLILIFSILLMIILSPLNAANILLTIAVEPIVYFIFTFLILLWGEKKGYNTFACVVAVFLGRIAIELPIRIRHFEDTLFTILPVVCCIISIFVSYLYYRFKYKAIFATVIGVAIWLYCIFGGQKALMHYTNFGNCSLQVNVSNEVVHTLGDSLRIEDLKYKYLFLDFWSANCGVCYKEFPTLQKLYDNNSRKDLFIGSVFVKYANNKNLSIGDSIIKSKDYTFPVFAVNAGSGLKIKSGIKVYPTVLIIDSNGIIIYAGSIEEASDKLEELLDG